MIKLGSFTLFLSWQCNLACEHCGFSCGPQRKERMSFQEAVDYIDQASANPDLEMIAFSGGEPFLLWRDLKELMAYSFDKGLSTGVVTNCYWAEDYSKTLAVLGELKQYGLKEIITSLDDYHQRHVPAENITHVVRAAARLGIYTGINMLVTRKSRLRKHNASLYLGVDLEELVSARKLWIKESSPILSGRAKYMVGNKHIPEEDFLLYGERDLLYSPCHYVVRNSIVTPEGAFYACCGLGGASELGPASLAYVGNIKSEGFEKLFGDASQNLLFNIIYFYGPYILLKMAEQAQPGLKFRKQYKSCCEVCEEIAANTALARAVKDALESMSARSAV